MMSNSIEQMVRQFNDTFKPGESKEVATLPDEAGATLMNNLILEELQELNEAFDQGDIIGVADALADILYVTAQQAALHGFPVDALLREVQRSNMSKLGADGNPIIRDDGKVLKGPNFSEPNLAAVLNTQKALHESSTN